MRFVVIDAKLRRIFDLATPHRLGEEFIAGMLGCDFVERVELAPGLDLWISPDPCTRTFRFFANGPEFPGNGLLTGRTMLGDFKSLPRGLCFEAISNWLVFPERRAFENPLPRRKYQRPSGFPQAGLTLNPYHGIAPDGARENPYVMQMYG